MADKITPSLPVTTPGTSGTTTPSTSPTQGGTVNIGAGVVQPSTPTVTAFTGTAAGKDTGVVNPVVHPAAQVQVADANSQAAAVVANTNNPKTPAPTPTTPTTPTNKPSFISTSDQNAIANAMSGTSSDTLNSAGSAAGAFSSASSGVLGTLDVQSQIENQLNTLMSAANNPPPSFLNQYQSMLTQFGIPEDQQNMVNLQKIMNGTTDDIRSEITAHGGFATESQIQALAATRNNVLQKQYDSLQSGLTLKEQWVNNYMQYAETDYTNASNAFEKNFQMQDTLLKTLQTLQTSDATAQYRFQTQQFNKLKFMLDSGALANATPDVLASYSATTGIDMQTLQNAATNEGAKMQLSLQLQNANIAYKDARINPYAQLTPAKMSSYVAAGIDPKQANYINSQLMQGATLEQIRQGLDSTFGTGSRATLDTYMPIFQSGSGTKNFTATNIPANTKAQLLSDVQSGQYTADQLIAAYPEVASTYISSLITASAQ